MRNRSGLTRVELVVTLAVAGVLAAILLPVFARERVTLRDTKCIAHVRAIAVAIRMYAEEYEELWPGEQDVRVQDYFNGGVGRGRAHPGNCNRTKTANPYLRPAVILERYLKSRDVWRCPRATTVNRAAWIVPPGPNGDWLQGYREHQGEWGARGKPGLTGADQSRSGQAHGNPKGQSSGGGTGGLAGPCLSAFPLGWGGATTDSFLQGAGQGHVRADAPESQPPAFVQAIATNSNLTDLKLSRVRDPAKYIVCGDSGIVFEAFEASNIAFPDTCGIMACGYSSGDEECGNVCNSADWENCPWTRSCGLTSKAKDRFLTDAKYRKTFTRHSGGSNVGFLDGHAKWHESSFLLTHSEPFKKPAFEGYLCSRWPGNGRVPKDAGKHVKHAKKPAALKSRAKPTPQKKGR